mmetsp:Transcript_20085/g.42048  ORF Transcript_20085/g.42048 Transcript_20085/m.42048 type:complete len:394 (-) Transcript_20085:31-1212(-)
MPTLPLCDIDEGLATAVALGCVAIPAITAYSIGRNSVSVPTKKAKLALSSRMLREKQSLLNSSDDAKEKKALQLGELDVRRKCQIAKGGPTDHSGEVVVSTVPDFDLDGTIFGSLPGFLPRTVQKSKIAVNLFWSDPCIARIDKAYSQVPTPPPYKSGLIEFMQKDCDFAIEHADGSFMDHLKFCHDYCAYNAPGISPTPLFLHSIMGVGTNFFPMGKELIPKLKTLVSPTDFKQIEAFPSVLRLILGTDVLEEMERNRGRWDGLKEIRFHRVIDNMSIVLTAEEFWTQLNYQLIHTLDFLPAASWLNQMDDSFMVAFLSLHSILSTSKKMVCKVDYLASSGEKTTDGIPLTLGSIIRGLAPNFVLKSLARKAIGKFSKAIDHDLGYELVWDK